MSKFIVGTTVGLAIGYMIAKMNDEQFMEKVNNEMSDFKAKAKKKAKDIFDKGQNEAEYLKERAELAMENGKTKIDKLME